MLEIQNLTAGYGEFRALFGVSLTVNAGEIAAVLGPNGAGKSTLLRAISGMIPVQSGGVTMEGQSLVGLPAHQILPRGIAHVPEHRRLFPKLTVEENIKLGAYHPSVRGEARERLRYVYDLFPRLFERRSQLAGTMSGGEQQMCAIGRALMSKPKLLLLDEPSAGLSPVMVATVFDMVRRVRSEGYTVLIVEQSVKQMLKLSDQAYVLVAGQIRLRGQSQALLENDEIQAAYLG